MTTSATVAARVSGLRTGRAGRRRPHAGPAHSGRIGMAFVAPFLFFLILFQYVPIGMLVRNSFFDYTLLRPDEQKFVGIGQYERIFTDPGAASTFGTTLLFALGVLVLVVPLGFLVAVFLNGRFPGRSIVRTIVFLPVVT